VFLIQNKEKSPVRLKVLFAKAKLVFNMADNYVGLQEEHL